MSVRNALQQWGKILWEKLLIFSSTADYLKLRKQVVSTEVLPTDGFHSYEDWEEFVMHDTEYANWSKTIAYSDFRDDCERLGRKYGLDWRTVIQSIFLDISEVRPHPFEKPNWRLRTAFHYSEKHSRLLDRIKADGGWTVEWPDSVPPDMMIDPRQIDPYNLFKLVIEVPLDYPPDGINLMQREARKIAQEFCGAIGHPVKTNLKGSSDLQLYADTLRHCRESGCGLEDALHKVYDERGLWGYSQDDYDISQEQFASDLRQLYRYNKRVHEIED